MVTSVQRNLVKCRNEESAKLDIICRQAAPRIPMDVEKCHIYLKTLEYNLGYRKQEALERFFSILVSRNEASINALPLRMFELNDYSQEISVDSF